MNGKVIDFTKPQFKGIDFELIGEFRERDYVLSFPETAKRYELLIARLIKWNESQNK